MNEIIRRLTNPEMVRKVVSHPSYIYWLGLRAYERWRVARELGRLKLSHRGKASDFLPARNERLARVVAHAQRHTPYYRKLFAAHAVSPTSLANFSRLPLLDKEIIRRRRSELVADCIDALPHSVMNSGGSTGEPLEFLVSGGVDDLHHRFLYDMMGATEGALMAACDGTEISQALRDQHVYWAQKRWKVYGDFALSSLYLDDSTIEYYARHLLDTRPAMIRGYPSMISDLARYVLKRGLDVTFPMNGIILTSENTHGSQIEAIRAAFKTKIYYQYGHSEQCVFAYTLDDSQEYYCSPFYGLTEVIGSTGRHVGVGEVGEVVVTGFQSWAMPFIRYRTGDLAEFGGDEKGIVRLRRLVGRTQDAIFTRDGQRVSLTALVFGCHYHAFASIRKWQLVQERCGEVTIKIVKDVGYSVVDEAEIRRNFVRIGRIATTFEYVDSVPLTPRGKSQLLVQRVQT